MTSRANWDPGFDGTVGISLASGGTKTASDSPVSAAADTYYAVDASGGPVDVELPTSPDDGAVVQVVVLDGANNTTISSPSTTIQGGADYVISSTYKGVVLQYYASASEWASISLTPIETDDLADDAVTTAKIADGDVTTGSLAASAVTTAKIDGSEGTGGQILTTDGTASGVSWTDESTGGGSGSGSTLASGTLGTLSTTQDYADFTLTAVTASATSAISDVAVHPADSQALTGEYPFHAEWSTIRDYDNGETDVFVRVIWDSDTRPANIDLDYAVYEGIGGGTSATLTAQEDGTGIGTFDTLNAGSGVTGSVSGDVMELTVSGGGSGAWTSETDDGASLLAQDLSTISGSDGVVYRHNGASSITANGSSTDSPGYYVWSATDTEWKTLAAY